MPRPVANSKPEPALTPELRDFLDRAIMPAIVEGYLAELAAADAASSEVPGLRAPGEPVEDSSPNGAPPLDTA